MHPPTAGAAATKSRFLDLPALASLANMRFTTRSRIEGAYSGRHQSRRQGSAGEFVDYREYSEGEDLRRLDWKVLGRSGRAYVRLYQDETNLACLLAVDASSSMTFRGYGKGTHSQRVGSSTLSKLEYAQYLASAFSHVITQSQDHVGLTVLANKLTNFIPPGSTGTHLASVYETIEQIAPQPSTTIAAGLREVFERSGRCGVIVVMSDFLQDDLEELFRTLRLFRHRRWEVVTMHLVHPDEEHLPEGIAFRFHGLEEDGEIACSPREISHQYESRFAAHLETVRTLALAGNCDYHLISTGLDYLQTVRRFLISSTG